MAEFIGRFHPVLVHLPIGMLLLALLFEALSRCERYRELRSSVPLVLLLGAVASAFSCLTGWLLSQHGEYEPALLSRHQWLGISVAIVSFSAYWLKIRQIPAASRIAAILLLPGILLTGHWGITLTHGEDYLTKSSQTELESEPAPSFPNVPDVEVKPASAAAIEALQKAGATVLPVGKEQPFLSLNFVNMTAFSPDVRQSLMPLAENVVWLKLSGMTLNDSDLALISNFENVTKLFLDRTNVADSSLVFLQKMKRLVYLNLVGTKVTAQGVSQLGELPNLKKLYLYQTSVTSGDLAVLQAKFPNAQINLGGYQVPVLATDTTFLPLE
jgi:uncharacterized membrane protein